DRPGVGGPDPDGSEADRLPVHPAADAVRAVRVRERDRAAQLQPRLLPLERERALEGAAVRAGPGAAELRLRGAQRRDRGGAAAERQYRGDPEDQREPATEGLGVHEGPRSLEWCRAA